MPRKKRRCAARKCTETVKPTALMCREHWAMVPTPIKREVSAAYKERGGYPSAPMTQRYARALVAAVNAVTPVERAQAAAGVALDPETLFAHPDDTCSPIHDLYDDTPIGSDQPPDLPTQAQIDRWYEKTLLFGERYSSGTGTLAAFGAPASIINNTPSDPTEAFDWRKHMKAEFIILEDTTACHLHVIHNQESADHSHMTCIFECAPCNIKYAQTYEINSCDTCNARGGTLSGEVQGDGHMTGYVEFFEVCDDCIGIGLCPGCSNGTLIAGVWEAAMDDIDTFTCEICGWHYDAARFYPDEPDYGMADYRDMVDGDDSNTSDTYTDEDPDRWPDREPFGH